MSKTILSKFLIALPHFPNGKGFNHPTILVSAENKTKAIDKAIGILISKGKRVINIGDVKKVNY